MPAARTKTSHTETAERLARMETNIDHLRSADTHQEDLLKQILEEARKTNGRVNKHDQWIAESEMRTKFMQDSLTGVTSLAGKHEMALQRSRGVWIAVSTISAAIGAVAGLIVAFLK